MLNRDKLDEILSSYKKRFKELFNGKSKNDGEKYKWVAVKRFQDVWDINAPDFLDMFMKATDKTLNLLASQNNLPRGMIKEFATKDPEAVREMFINLYDESKDVTERIRAFSAAADEIKDKYNPGSWQQHYQGVNAISTYLWLRYPDKYYIYKYSEISKATKITESDFIAKKGYALENFVPGLDFYGEICKAISEDAELVQMLKDEIDDTCYSDEKFMTMAIDVGFYISRYIADEKIDDFSSNAEVLNWYTPVVLALRELGGSAKRKDVHQKIIEMQNISEEMLAVKNEKSNTSKLLNNIDWARNYLAYEGILDKSQPGVWALTDLGWKVNMTHELAEKIHLKWIRIKTAERKKEPIPEIDISKYYFDDSKYTKEDFLNDVYISSEKYDSLVSLLNHKLNVILQGAPGVGKTYAAKRLAYSIMGKKDDSKIEFVQFHQNYSYEDFIMGYKPNGDSFKLTNGIFYNFCKKAESNPNEKYFFIIDEINRGNMSKIFGELLMLIEKDYRGTKATLAYNGLPFSVPENLYIIGMMNTADRSLAMIDYALRRRFSFCDMEPGFTSDGFVKYQKSFENETLDALVDKVKELNTAISKDSALGKGFCIGHSYFCGHENETDDNWLSEIVEYDIIPMISEYWFDDNDKLLTWKNNLRGVLND